MGTLTRKSLRRGLEVIEAVLTLPIVLLVLFGIAQYGLWFYQEQTVTNIARQTARVAAVPGGDYADTFTNLTSQAGAQYSNLTPTYTNVGGTSGTLLSVTVSMPYNSPVGTFGGWVPIPGPRNSKGQPLVSATVSMENEGP